VVTALQFVIARSRDAATRQSSLDCFASLAMTVAQGERQ